MTKPRSNLFFVFRQFEVCVPFYLNSVQVFFRHFPPGGNILGLSDCKFCYSFVENIHLFENVDADHLFLWKPSLSQTSYFPFGDFF